MAIVALISPSTDLLLLVLAVSIIVLSGCFAAMCALNKVADDAERNSH